MPDDVLVVDGHAHIYDKAAVPAMLDAAAANFSAALSRQGESAGYGLVLLADPPTVPGFEWIRERCATGEAAGWSEVSRPDHSVVHLVKEDRLPLAIIGGRQLVTAENLELLVFPAPDADAERRSLAELTAALTAAGHLVILPWGVGKWTGHRAQIVRSALGVDRRDSLAVGDNGGRPAFWSRVRLLEEAGRLGYPDIAGTDPLPIPGDMRRIGSYGVMTNVTVGAGWDTPSLISLLTKLDLRPYGDRGGLVQFVCSQGRLRWS